MATLLARLNSWVTGVPLTPEKRALSFETIFGHDIPRDDVASRVTVEEARKNPFVWACQSIISGTIANLPMDVLRKEGATRIEVTPEPSWIDEPNPMNPNYTSISYKRQVSLSLLQDGNAFVAVLPDVFNPLQLLVLNPAQVQIRDGNGFPTYVVTDFAQRQTLGELTPLNCLHIPFILPPGYVRGLSPIEAAALTIGIDLASQKQASKFVSGGGLVTGVIEVPESAGALTQPQKDDLRDSFKRRREGPSGYSIGILDGGATFKPMSLSQAESDYIASRKMSREEIAGDYLVPAFMIGSQEPGGVAYASAEARAQHFIDYCLMHYTGPIELGHKRLVPGGSSTEVRFNYGALLRGDLATRYAAYEKGLQNKFLYLEDVWSKEDLNPDRAGAFLETPNNNGPKPAKPAPVPPPPPVAPRGGDTNITIADGAIRAETTVHPPTVEAQFALPVNNVDARTVVAEGAVVYHAAPTTVEAAPTPDVNVTVEAPVQRAVRRVIEHDRQGKPVAIVESPVDGE